MYVLGIVNIYNEVANMAQFSPPERALRDAQDQLREDLGADGPPTVASKTPLSLVSCAS
jgi:hypothetical protein